MPHCRSYRPCSRLTSDGWHCLGHLKGYYVDPILMLTVLYHFLENCTGKNGSQVHCDLSLAKVPLCIKKVYILTIIQSICVVFDTTAAIILTITVLMWERLPSSHSISMMPSPSVPFLSVKRVEKELFPLYTFLFLSINKHRVSDS